jgi:hypothetical protein
MTHFHLTLVSNNAKTGKIPVSTSSADTCPKTCGQFETCYAKTGPLALHWKKITAGARGTNLREFTAAIEALPAGQLWRHNQAGDLPGTNETIDAGALAKLVKANIGKRGFSYTHKKMNAKNAAAVKHANANGFTVNLSADTLKQADTLKAQNIGPVVVVLPANVTTNQTTPAGHKVVICPATNRNNVTCASCKLCAWPGRQVIIGFPAHGSKKNQVKSDLIQIT